MPGLIEFITDFGNSSLSAFWFPLLIWSVCAALIHRVLRHLQNRDPLYHYYLRVALVVSLPLGIGVTGLAGIISGLTSSAVSTVPSAPIVIQSPITLTATGSTASITWSNPHLLTGMVTLVTIFVGICFLLYTGFKYYRLSKYAANLQTLHLNSSGLIKRERLNIPDTSSIKDVYIAFSAKANVPFTFGWRCPIVVIPKFLTRKPEKMRIAVQHELMHIKRADYLVNGLITILKCLFWFHPLIYLLDNEILEYREISCDSEVLTDRSISRKEYAKLLFELASRNKQYIRTVVSMAVNQSSLKTRIQKLKDANSHRPVLKSMLVSLGLLIGISGFFACSDLQDPGITNTELKETPPPPPTAPLEAPNDEVIEDQGLNIDPEMDLGQKLPPPPPTNEEESFFVVVEDMPQLKEGRTQLQQCVKYPEIARKAGMEGRVIIQFIVNKQGHVEDPTVMRSAGGSLDQEALRCVKQSEFTPGMQRGNPVRVQYSLPVVFQLQGNSN